MYSNTLKWKSPIYREKEERHARNLLRTKFCKDSCAWTDELNMAEHRAEMKRLLDDYNKSRPVESAPIRPAAMEAKEMPLPAKWTTNHSAVLALRTAFVPASEARTDDHIEWPSQKEMFNEGDDRIQKDQKIHLRMLATPRTSGNDTVAILLRKFADPLPLDDFRPGLDEESILMRGFVIGDLEFTDEEGTSALGKDLMSMLDPVDCF